MMNEMRRFLRFAVKRATDWIAGLIANRELSFVTLILAIYFASLVAVFTLLYFSRLRETQVVTFTISASCVTFLLAQIAFLTRAKTIERYLQLKNALAGLMEEAHSQDQCIVSYISIGDQKAQIIRESKQEVKTAKQVILELSLLAIETCKTELVDMLKKKRIERSGNLAYLLTQECYQFADKAIKAIALVTDDSLTFWRQAQGVGRFFYECNRRALDKGVHISRYFVFTSADITRLQADSTYRNTLIDAVSKYIEELPETDLYFAYRDQDWQALYPDKHIADGRRVKANRKFKEHYADSFPDVSLFDDSVASLWKGASSDKVDEVRIAWEPMHVACVREVFENVLKIRNTVLVQRNKIDTAEDLLSAFLSALTQSPRAA